MKHKVSEKLTAAKESPNYVWEVYNDSVMKRWPKDNKIRYIHICKESYPFLNKAKGNREFLLTYPKPMATNIWDKYAVMSLGSASHTKGYYHSRIEQMFTDVLLVVKGVFSAKFDKHTVDLSAGSILIIPNGNMCDTFVKNVNTDVYWIHFANIPYWTDIIGDKILIRHPESFNEIVSLLSACDGEMYSEKRSALILELIAQALISVIRREFVGVNPEKSCADYFAKLVKQINSAPEKKWDAVREAKNSGVSLTVLNKYFSDTTSKSFSKYVTFCRMRAALDYLKAGGLTNSKIARKVGYSNAYSFSKAFRLFYGISPKYAKTEVAEAK